MSKEKEIIAVFKAFAPIDEAYKTSNTSPLFEYASTLMKAVEINDVYTKEESVEELWAHSQQTSRGGSESVSTVFNAWCQAVASRLLYALKAHTKPVSLKSFLEAVEKDVGWFKENFGRPLQSDESIEKIFLLLRKWDEQKGVSSSEMSRFFQIMFTSGLMSKDATLIMLTQAIASNDVETVNFLHSGGIDINAAFSGEEFVLFKRSAVEIVRRGKEVDYNAYGCLVNSVKMFDALSELGINWNYKPVNSDETVIEFLQRKDASFFENAGSRDEFLRRINQESLTNAKENPQAFLWKSIDGSTKVSDIVLFLRALPKGIKWRELRGPSGENVLHKIAESNPSLLRKFGVDNQEMMQMKDNNGLTPMIYAIGSLDAHAAAGFLTSEWLDQFLEDKISWLKTIEFATKNDHAMDGKLLENFEQQWRYHRVKGEIANFNTCFLETDGEGKFKSLQCESGREIMNGFVDKYLEESFQRKNIKCLLPWFLEKTNLSKISDLAVDEVDFKFLILSAYSVALNTYSSVHEQKNVFFKDFHALLEKAIDNGVDIENLFKQAKMPKATITAFNSREQIANVDNSLDTPLLIAKMQKKKLEKEFMLTPKSGLKATAL